MDQDHSGLNGGGGPPNGQPQQADFNNQYAMYNQGYSGKATPNHQQQQQQLPVLNQLLQTSSPAGQMQGQQQQPPQGNRMPFMPQQQQPQQNTQFRPQMVL